MQEFDEELKAGKGILSDPKSLLTNLMFPAHTKMLEFEVRWKALLRSTVTGLAAERFRLLHHRWPDSLEDLVPKFLERVEEDPFTGKSLLYKKFADGIAIYSVDENLTDNGSDVIGEIRTKNRERGNYVTALPTDIGIRLWNADKRGKSTAAFAAGR